MIVLIPAAHAMDNAHTLRGHSKSSLFVSHEDLTVRGARGVVETFKFEACKNIGVSTVAILLHGCRVHDVEPRRQDD